MTLDFNEMRLDIDNSMLADIGQSVTVKNMDQSLDQDYGTVESDEPLPSDATFFASFRKSINADIGGGNLQATSINEAAISDGKLDLTGDTSKYLTYEGLNNINNIHSIGAIRHIYTPDYSGTPNNDRVMFSMADSFGSLNNHLSLTHSSLSFGGFILLIRDKNGGNLADIRTSNFGPTEGEEYEIELSYDFIAGSFYLFINGQYKGSIVGNPALQKDRDNSINSLAIGAANGSNTSDFKIDEFICFNQMQHTSNFQPGVLTNYALIQEATETAVIMGMSEFSQKRDFGNFNPKRFKGYFRYDSIIQDHSIIIDQNGTRYVIDALHDAMPNNVLMKKAILIKHM